MLRLSVILAVSASFCSATTYYVSTQGSDSNPGTSQALAWATLQHAVDTISVGDTILVETGTYAGCRIGISGGLAPMVKTLEADPATKAQVLLNRPGRRSRRGSILEIGGSGSMVTDWTMSGFEVSGAWGNGIDADGTDRITIQGNHSHNNFGAGISATTSNDVTITGNQVDHNFGPGIQLRSNAGDGGNDFRRGSAPTGIQNATVSANTVFENAWFGGSGINADGLQASLISNNLLYNNHTYGITLDAGGDGPGSNGNKIYNNTIVMPQGSRYAINIPQDERNGAPSTGNMIMNNILYTPETRRGTGSIAVAQANLASLESDYNVVVSSFSGNNGRGQMTLTQWQALGFDAHSILAPALTQLFANPANQNYQLATGSPAIGKGTTLFEVPKDILGVARPVGGYDIGCYQSTSTLGPPLAI